MCRRSTKILRNVGRIVLWSNNSGNPRAPKYIGEIQAKEAGSKFRVSVWENKNKQKKDGRAGETPFLLTTKCWNYGKRLNHKDLEMNHCNTCAIKVPSRFDA